ncbi:MAG: alginate export family protein [Labilithrix sp.]|nr:alginate export family protein [Labilithrix sp.]
MTGKRKHPSRSTRRALLTAALGAAIFGATSRAGAVEPWSDADPVGPPERFPLSASTGFRGAAEYRANGVAVRPLDLNSTRDRHWSVLEHRLRLDAGLDWEDKVRLVTSVDVLDGVLWGDNGTRDDSATPTSGANVGTVNPNAAGPCVALRPGELATEPSSYRYGLCDSDPVFVRRLYGDVITPVGLLRIGRQPFTEGASIAVNDGDGRRNRFGFARRGNSADRILFATKPLEAFKPKAERDKSETRGVFLILAYDRLVTDNPQRLSDDLHGWITAVRWLEPTHRLGGDFEARLFHAYRWSRDNDTGVSALGGRVMSKIGSNLHAGMETSFVTGSTREVGDAVRVISNDPSVVQDIRQLGARATIKWDQPFYSLYLEGDYASGDSDPQTRTPLTQFRFADDANVGLLLFKHVLAHQSARAAAAGVAVLRDLGAPSYPLEQVATRGAFTNAAALFPQVDVRPVDKLLVRGGALFAWAPARLIDPIASLQRRDGNRLDDDLVNFVGGRPGRYYGTELDLRVQYRMYDHFVADLEAAVLFPGSALEDANGDAVRSWLGQARGTFYF